MEYRKLPKGWTYNTKLFDIEYDDFEIIYPEELEDKLCSERFISEALVLGVDNSKGGLSIKAKIYPCIEKLKEEYPKNVSASAFELPAFFVLASLVFQNQGLQFF